MRVIYLAIAFWPSLAMAVPSALLHQGRLVDSSGAPLNEDVAMDFSLWSEASGGVLLWQDSATVSLSDGYYSVVLGAPPMDAIDSSVFSTPNAYVQVHPTSQPSSQRTIVGSVPFALVAERLADEVVQLDDPRLLWSSPVIPLASTCTTGAWCDYGANWGVNRLAERGVYTECTGWDCSSNRVELVLDDNPWSSVQMSHLDWPNTGAFDVFLSFDGGVTYSFHKRVPTYRNQADQPFVSQIRTIATNLPRGLDVRVQVRGAYKRIHLDGFSLSRNVYPEDRDGTACPRGTVGVTGFCIQPATTAAFGQAWTTASSHCTDSGLRLCSQAELFAGIRHGAVPMYDHNVRDAWFVTAHNFETAPGSAGQGQTCDVQGNFNQPGHPPYSSQCSHDAETTASWRTTICCY